MDLSDKSEHYEQRILELEELEQERREKLVREALGKFNFFLHLTAYISGVAYLIILGVLMPKAMPYVWIPIGLWTAGVGYHMYVSFHPRSAAKRALKSLEKQKREQAKKKPDADGDDGGDSVAPADGDDGHRGDPAADDAERDPSGPTAGGQPVPGALQE